MTGTEQSLPTCHSEWERPACPYCGKRHTPNGTKVGEFAGAAIVIDCSVDSEQFPNGVWVNV